MLPKTYEAFSNKTYRESFEAGDKCLEELRKTVHQLGIKLTFNQIKFVEDMIRACLKFIFRNDFEQNVARLLKENNWSEIIQEVLIITARRMGKTTVVAAFSAALLICIPNVKLMIFSVSLNSSRKMISTIQEFLQVHEKGKEMLQRPNKVFIFTVL